MKFEQGNIGDIEKLIMGYLIETEADLDQFVNLFPQMSDSASKIKKLITIYNKKYQLNDYVQISQEIKDMRTFEKEGEELKVKSTLESNLLDSIFELLEIILKPFVVEDRFVILNTLIEKLKNPNQIHALENIGLRRAVKQCEDLLAGFPAAKHYGPAGGLKRFDHILLMFFQLKIHELLPEFVSYQCCKIFGDGEIDTAEKEILLHEETKVLFAERFCQIKQSRKKNLNKALMSSLVSLLAFLNLSMMKSNDDGTMTSSQFINAMIFFISVIFACSSIKETLNNGSKLKFFQDKSSILLAEEKIPIININLSKLHRN